MNHLRILAMLTCAAVACAGCNRAWEAYEQIELGKPIPEDNLLMVEGERIDDVLGWGKQDLLIVPACGAWAEVEARLDADGRVVAKFYTARVMGHWLVLQSAAGRTVMDVIVPVELFIPPPHEGSPRSRQSREIPETPTNALEFLLFTESHGRRGFIPAYERNAGTELAVGVLFPLSLFMSGTGRELSELTCRTDEFADMTEDGFDWTYRDPYGATVRVRNLGNRQFRVETKHSRVFDPLMLLAAAQAALLGDTHPCDPPPLEDSLEYEPYLDDVVGPPDTGPDAILDDGSEADEP